MTLRELGIVPVFPPREDVFVGDIYAYAESPDSGATRRLFETPWKDLSEPDRDRRQRLGMSPRLVRLDLNQLLLCEYTNTLSAPATPSDYNSITGNQALAAAADKVVAAKKKVAELEKKLEGLKSETEARTADVLKAQREKEDADKEVERRERALTTAQSRVPDVTVEEQRVASAKLKQRGSQDAVTAARRRMDETTPNTPERTAAEQAFHKAEQTKADDDLAVQRAEDDLTAARAKRPDAQRALTDLDAAKANQTSKEVALLNAQRNKTDAESKQRAAEVGSVDELKAARDAVSTAESIRDAIAKAGEKTLYAQPRDSAKNVYTAQPLTGGTGPDDLSNARVNRLRLVGFPEFASASFTQGDLSALIPIEAFSLGLNVSAAHVSRVSVKVPSAESYALPIADIRSRIATVVGARDHATVWRLNSTILEAARFQLYYKDRKDSEEKAYFRVITEVFYARALDVSVFSADSFGARAQLSALGTEGLGQGSGSGSASHPPAMTPASINAGPVGSSVASSMLGDIQSHLGNTLTVPGGSVQLVSYNEQAVGLRRVFDRPIAIGYRGLLLEVRLKDGEITRVSESYGGVPTID